MANIGNKIQANYDDLASIANQFAQEAASMEQLLNKVQSLVGDLQNGGWIGRGANSFFNEMHDLVFPGMGKLVRALEDAGNATKQISTIVSQAEQEASSLFSRQQ
jgi:WXG100 family type VII secretion target